MQDREKVEESHGQLLRRIAAGDLPALAEFYDQTAGPLFSLACRILGDPAEAEEVIQDVFVQIWEKAGAFEPTLGAPFNWALSITRHRSIDRLRSRQRRARLLDEFQSATPSEWARETSPDGLALAAETSKTIRSALQHLPKEQRQAIEMAFFGGFTHEEIALALQEPLGTIKARIRRAMLKLRDALQEYA